MGDKGWGDDFEITPKIDEKLRQIEAGASNASSSAPAAASHAGHNAHTPQIGLSTESVNPQQVPIADGTK